MATLLLTDALADSLAAAVAQGVPIETAAASAGVSGRQFYEWLVAAERGVWREGQPVSDDTKLRLSRFSQQIAAAQAEWEAKQVIAITEDAARYNEKTGQRDWRARAWLLNNHPRTRRTYHEAKELEVTTHNEPPLEQQLATKASTEELERWSAELAALPPGDQG